MDALLTLARILDDDNGGCKPGNDSDNPGGAPPGSAPTYKFEGPWFTTQLMLASFIGIMSFILFSVGRTRWPLLFAPRTKLKGFSPHEAHSRPSMFGWIMPTIQTSEFTILQIVGLDAAVLLSFFKMSFKLFSVCSFFAITILMPVNYMSNAKEDNKDRDDDDDWPCFKFADGPRGNRTAEVPRRQWVDLISDANSYLTVHLLFTFLFTFITLYFLYKNYRRFIRSRQLFSLELVHSIAARTVMVTELPPYLRGERALAEYFEAVDLPVESVSVCREVGSLKELLDARTKALLALERAWTDYIGNPSTLAPSDPTNNVVAPLVDIDGVEAGGPPRLVVPHRARPTMRPSLVKPYVDALDYLDQQFQAADEAVRDRRAQGKFKATHAAFVTFEKMSAAQMAVQTAQASSPFDVHCHIAPEPRDIVWANMTHSPRSITMRELFVLACITVLFMFWIVPIDALAMLLSYKQIKKTMPWLGELIDKDARVQAVVQNSLPSVAMISLNAVIPFLLEGLTYFQGYRARSLVEYSLMKKYFLFLLVNVVFIFLLATTYWQLVRDLANAPGKIPERIAESLSKGRAKHFFLSYVILQGLGIMPLQLLNLGVVVPRLFYLMFITRTPRDFAELNAPPMINYGVVYPQAILVFVVTLLYSVVQPLILIFGALYFGCAYVVYKYKLLFVFYKPYESQGQAWPITFVRLMWAVVIFLVFMTGIFLLRASFIAAGFLGVLLGGAVVWSWYIYRLFGPLSKFVGLNSVCEVQRGEEAAEVTKLKTGHPVTWSQSNLNRRRYAQNDETLYVAPEDERTDYSQPPMANWYSGVLNTGKRRYGHPALNGVLPQPWLPLKKGETLVNRERPNGVKVGDAVVLTMRRRWSQAPRGSRMRKRSALQMTDTPAAGPSNGSQSYGATNLPPDANPWVDTRPRTQRRASERDALLQHRLSFDGASGVIMLPDDDDWLMEDVGSDSDSEDYGTLSVSPSREPSNAPPADGGAHSDSEVIGERPASASGSPVEMRKRRQTYFHHPERRRQTIPGAFPGPSAPQ